MKQEESFEERIAIIRKVLKNKEKYHSEYGYMQNLLFQDAYKEAQETFNHEIKLYSFWELLRLWLSKNK